MLSFLSLLQQKNSKKPGCPFSRMHSKGSRFTLGVWGLRVCSLDVVFVVANVRNRPQPFATVRNRPRDPRRKSRTKCSFFCTHVSRPESLVFLWRRRVYGGSSALHTLHFTLHTPQFSTLYTPHFTLCTLHSSLLT